MIKRRKDTDKNKKKNNTHAVYMVAK